MRILVSNDDGISSPGLTALVDVARDYGDVWVVAPDSEQSAQSHSLTLHQPLRATQVDEQRFAVTGTPADCIYLALNALLDAPPDLVLSGINKGSNLGTDIFYSGTVAAAREGALAGLPAVALSLHLEPGDTARHWETAQEVVRRVVPNVAALSLPDRTLLNVNVPNVPLEALRGLAGAPMSVRRYDNRVFRRDDPFGRPYYWIGGGHVDFQGAPDGDGPVVEQGFASVTPVHSDLTHSSFLEEIRDWTDR